jgi:hypothetical protein
MASIDGLVVVYQHIASTPATGDEQLELEVRFERVEYPLVETLLTKLAPHVKGGSFEVVQNQTLNTLRQQGDRETTRGVYRAKKGTHLTDAQQILELRFEPDGTRSRTFYKKARMAPPVRVRPAPGALGYRVVFSQEIPIPPFPTAGNVTFRVKNRLSYMLRAGAAAPELAAFEGWRLDITIVRELAGSAAGSLPAITAELFGLRNKKTIQTPETILEALGLAGDVLPTADRIANQQQYKYEIELEYVGDTGALTMARIEGAINALLLLANPDFLLSAQMQSELREVASHIVESPALLQKYASGEWGLKQLSPQVISMTRGEYGEIYPPVGMFLTDKAHGIHAIAIVRDGRAVIIAPGLLPEPMVELYFPGVGQPTISTARAVGAVGATIQASALAKMTKLTILDGEVVMVAGAGDKHTPQFLAFDALASNGELLVTRPFSERVQELVAATSALALFFPAQPKPFIHLIQPDAAYLRAQFDSMITRKDRRYGTDGLVLYAPGESYGETIIKKWKPFEENTIDFLARRPPASVRGVAPFIDRPDHTLYFLFVGISNEKMRQFNLTRCAGYAEMFPAHSRATGYFPIQFSPSDQPYAYLFQYPNSSAKQTPIENRIIELMLTSVGAADGTSENPAPGWELVRVRADRDEDLQKGRLFGNNFKTAELTWVNFRDPLEFSMLATGPGLGYFSASKRGIYTAQTSFMSSVKHQILTKYVSGQDFVVDLGAGRGQDIGRYMSNRVGAVLMVDNDPAALAELVRRKHSWNMQSVQSGGNSSKMSIYLRRADFTEPFEAVSGTLRKFPSFPSKGADSVVCNLAAHYAFGSATGMRNFVYLIRSLLRPGGQAILTILDGERVFAKFRESGIPANHSWDLREDGILKYSIKRLFRQNELTTAGQKIGVLLPFSRGELYEEYVTNVSALISMFEKAKFVVQDRRNVWESYGSGQQKSSGRAATLTPNDREWLSMFAVLSFQYTG